MLACRSIVLQSQWYVCLHKRTAKFSSAKCFGVEIVTTEITSRRRSSHHHNHQQYPRTLVLTEQMTMSGSRRNASLLDSLPGHPPLQVGLSPFRWIHCREGTSFHV